MIAGRQGPRLPRVEHEETYAAPKPTPEPTREVCARLRAVAAGCGP
jgi:hypothetical protein